MSTDGKNKIREAALRVISEQGIAGATMRVIAKEAGVSTGAIYHYYPAKEDILYDIMDVSLKASTQVAERAKSGEASRLEIARDVYENLIERFKKVQENRLQFYLAHEAILGNEQLQKRFQEKYDEWISRIEDILLAAYEAREGKATRAFAAWLLAAVDGMVLQDLLDVKAADKEMLMQVFDILLTEGIPCFLQLMEKKGIFAD
ncbi:transcriptional regulator, TetR family [Thermosyntropha lipolytica DSM 11003]|uniref:Transcriptional regulator, TetR family n=1 Tax=Thermosyntropha lipolytica DSM 11003 TaxID=1123382 RepID=A0A1M5PHN0_9FIRM|nr:TetR/AcrR family transcriptional regulator [Thermosyntropha lipolytica]SHH01228.1 transcriptional regulator, TetR family [Thermosyntropha lipolytica DSM 11003]